MFVKSILNIQRTLPIILGLIITLSSPSCLADTYDILILGDSISSGFGVSEEENWANQFADHVQLCGYSTHNLSVPGATTEQGLQTLIKFYNQHHAQLLILELGGNDGLQGKPTEYIHEQLVKIIDRAHEQNTTVLLIGIDLPPNYGKEYRKCLQQVFEDVAHHTSSDLVMLTSPKDTNLMQEDNTHPNPKGHQTIYEDITHYFDSTHTCNNQTT